MAMTAEQCAKVGVQTGSSPLRRLTGAEYDNTVHDLLGDSTGPAKSFPPEELTLGFPNNADQQSVSDLLIEEYETAATTLATAAVANLPALLACNPTTQGEDTCVRGFLPTFGRKAYRRPLAEDEVDRLFALYANLKQASDFTTAVKMTLEAMFQSPHFLYRVEVPGTAPVSKVSAYELASRLSFLLWSSMPDATLLDAAAANRLESSDSIRAQVERMLQDPRASRSVSTFFSYWLDFDRLRRDDPKDTAMFPGFNATLIGLLRQEADAFTHDAFFNGGSLKTVLTASHSFMNKTLAQFYGVTGPTGDIFEKVELDPTRRGGFLTLGGFLAGYAKINETAPVLRGLFVRERLLCDAPPPPPPNIPSLPPPSPTASVRERLAQHRTNAACAGCHTLMDPIGFGFEHYSAVGQWRDMDHGAPIDAHGEIVHSDIDGKFDGAIELATKLSQSKEAEACAVRQWFRYGYGRSESDLDQCTMLGLEKSFESSQGNWKDLVVALTLTDAFLYRNNQQGAAQ
jgi:hypothetical protein